MSEVLYFFEMLFLFFLSATVAFYIPGRLVVGQKKKSTFVIIVESFVLGMMLWSIQGFILGFLQLRVLTYPYLFFCIVIFFYKGYYKNISFKIFKNLDSLAILTTVIGLLPQTLVFAQTGFIASQGVKFPFHNTTDHIWHASLVLELTKRFPPFEPAMYGVLLKNYHIIFYLIIADLIRVFHLPLLGSQFIGMYLFLSILFAAVLYLLGITFYPGKAFGRWLIFLWLFTSDIGYIFIFLLRHTFSLNMLGSIQSIPLLIDNPPFVVASIFASFALYYYFPQIKNLTWKTGIISTILFGILIECKAYVGIPFLMALWILAGVNILQKKWTTLFIVFFASVISALLFLPFSNETSGMFFLPLDRQRDFIIQKQFNLSFLDQRWTIYMQHHNIPRLIEYGILFIVVYYFVQFGIRLLGLYPLKKTREILGKEMLIFLYTVFFSSSILGLFFFQKVGGANIWEFFLITLIVLIFITGLNLSVFLEKKPKNLIIIVVFIAVAISFPNWIYHSYTYIKEEYSLPFYGVNAQRIEAYNYIHANTPLNSIFLPVENYSANSSITNVFLDRNVLLSGLGVTQVATPLITQRVNEVNIIETSKNVILVKKALQNLNVDYLLFYGKPNLKVTINQIHGKIIFKNSQATIVRLKE